MYKRSPEVLGRTGIKGRVGVYLETSLYAMTPLPVGVTWVVVLTPFRSMTFVRSEGVGSGRTVSLYGRESGSNRLNVRVFLLCSSGSVPTRVSIDLTRPRPSLPLLYYPGVVSQGL